MNVHYLHLFSTKVFCLLNFSCSIICVIYMIRMYMSARAIFGEELSTFNFSSWVVWRLFLIACGVVYFVYVWVWVSCLVRKHLYRCARRHVMYVCAHIIFDPPRVLSNQELQEISIHPWVICTTWHVYIHTGICCGVTYIFCMIVNNTRLTHVLCTKIKKKMNSKLSYFFKNNLIVS